MLPKSLRIRILLVVLAVTVIPMALLGLWLTNSTVRASRELVASRVTETLTQTSAQIGERWIRTRSRLLDFAESVPVQTLLSRGVKDSLALRAAFEFLGPEMIGVRIAGRDGSERWSHRRSELEAGLDAALPTMSVPLDVYARGESDPIGRLDVSLGTGAILPPEGVAPAAPGLVLALLETATGVSLRPLPFDPALLSSTTFTWGGDEWLAESRVVVEPPVTLAAAAPLTAFMAPFEKAARQGTLLLFAVAVTGFALVILLTSRFTRSLRTLSAAARSIAEGRFDQRVETEGDDEVANVAVAFNTMAESLQRSLRELARKESLAAVGEFAASLAHEVRNPLTAIRVDLQRVEENLEPDSPLRMAQQRALREIARLDETVGRTLTKARRGDSGANLVDLRTAIRLAAEAAQPSFDNVGAQLRLTLPDRPLTVQGDLAALEQLFLNLLQNAAQALDRDGVAVVELTTGTEDVTVTVRDTGRGIPEDLLDRVFEPLFTTREGGTGLGLAICRRIAEMHGATLELESTESEGTTIRVRFEPGGNEATRSGNKPLPEVGVGIR